MSIALGVAATLLPVQVFLGDGVANAEFPYQPAKGQAVEGNWTNGNAGWVIFAIPDQQAQRRRPASPLGEPQDSRSRTRWPPIGPPSCQRMRSALNIPAWSESQ